MDSNRTDRDLHQAIRAALAALAETQAEIERVLSVGPELVSDQDLIKAGVQLQLSLDAVNAVLILRGYGPESRG